MKELITLVIFCFYFETVQSNESATTRIPPPEEAHCQTPKEQSGICINLHECDELLTILKSQPITPENRHFLRESQCGLKSGSVLVCCPKNMTKRINTHLLPDKCGEHVESRYYGSWTELDYFPWVAHIRSNSTDGAYNCSGALINERYVLTTARCVNEHQLNGIERKILSVRLGEHNINTEKDCDDFECADPAIDVFIEEIISHTDYNRTEYTEENDIALIRLTHTVNFTDFVRPICLPIGFALNRTGFQVTGWGPDGEKKQDFIQSVPLEDCNEKLRVRDKSINLGPTHLCAGGERGFTNCLVNSGNLLMTWPYYQRTNNLYLAGLFSFGPDKCKSEESPSVYTRVDAHVDWILKHLRA
ncbi:serine protease easter-like [Bradysia coprophila]|uniref:serine protease easter-like n=1 Tax=Bradysia coprophila TaxID=38358 RepID=UPI00187DBE28|nr:serine protease easter-like [Bradysia coprophila]